MSKKKTPATVRPDNPFEPVADTPGILMGSPRPATTSVQSRVATEQANDKRRKEQEQRAAATPAPAGRIKVEATQTGYYDHARRRPGDVFTIDGTQDADGNVIAFADVWMKRVDERTPERMTLGNQEIARKNAAVRDMRFGGGSAPMPLSSGGDDDNPLGDE